MGQPNVGKSAFFNRVAGTSVAESNYPGTTVDYSIGHMRVEGSDIEIIDVPGIFSIRPKDRAEEVAVKLLEEEKEATVICVIDATKIERGLYLALEIIEKGYPVLIALNMWDMLKRANIKVDSKRMEYILGVPVVSTIASRGEGFKDIALRMKEVKPVNIEDIKTRANTLHNNFDNGMNNIACANCLKCMI